MADAESKETSAYAMNSNTLLEPTPTRTKLRCFTLYADFHAGVRAKRLMHRLSKLAGDYAVAQTEMWKLDSVVPMGFIREMVAQEAGQSDVLIVAVSAATEPNPAVGRWLDLVVPWREGRPVPGLLVGLLGDEDHAVHEQSGLPLQLQKFAERTGMDFVWHIPRGATAYDFEWLETPAANLFERLQMSATQAV